LTHTPVVQDESANASEFFPIIHTLFSNIKAWLVGTRHGVSAKHLPRYLREWSYRFNRRNLPDGLDVSATSVLGLGLLGRSLGAVLALTRGSDPASLTRISSPGTPNRRCRQTRQSTLNREYA
jgi:hypothetical protein